MVEMGFFSKCNDIANIDIHYHVSFSSVKLRNILEEIRKIDTFKNDVFNHQRTL